VRLIELSDGRVCWMSVRAGTMVYTFVHTGQRVYHNESVLLESYSLIIKNVGSISDFGTPSEEAMPARERESTLVTSQITRKLKHTSFYIFTDNPNVSTCRSLP
jgi:hypothetical protein